MGTGTTAATRREAVDAACASIAAGASHVVFGMPASDYKRLLNFLSTHDCMVDFHAYRTGEVDPSTRIVAVAAHGPVAHTSDDTPPAAG